MSAPIKVLMFLIFFISFCTILVAGEDTCAKLMCRGEDQPTVHFPFTLEGHHDKSCGYPGFNLSCDGETNGTVLDLGLSGKFAVRAINYISQEVQIYDQDDCLPRRLLTLDLAGTPFKGYFDQTFNFYNCSSNFSSSFLEPIGCLSTPNQTVYAATSIGPPIFSTCEIITAAMVPMWEAYDRMGFFTDLNADLHLLWGAPNCGECLIREGTCRFKNRNKNEIGCYNLPRRVGISKVAKYILAVGLGLPALMFVLLVVGYMSGRFKSYRRNSLRHTELSASVLPQPPIFVVGLDESVIQSYPKVVLGESRRLVKPEDNICPICLSEYRAKETLKTIPDCKHCFHAACIDQWLRRNVTCPLCRNVPMPMPAQGPVPLPPLESHPV